VSKKQDRQGARTAQDLERKYGFGRTFAEIEGIATDARDSVTELEAEVAEEFTTIRREYDSVIMEAVKNGVTEEELQSTISTQLALTSEQLLLTFTQRQDATDKSLNDQFKELRNYIRMSGGVLTFSDSVSQKTLSLNNGKIQFASEGHVFGEWDGDNFYTGNLVIKVDERAQLGNFAYIPRTDGSLMFLKVGDSSGNS
jgi:hypothetical protein